MLAEELAADIPSIFGLVALIFAVQGLHHDALQDAILVARQQRVPVRTPDQFQNIPASTTEVPLKLLDDLAVAAHWPIQTLQIAVDDEHEVIEFLASRQTDRPQRLGFIHFAVTAKDPDLAITGIRQTAGVQVFEESGLIDRHQRPETHGDGRELPELGHQLGMRVTRQALAIDLLTEVIELVFAESPLQIGAPVKAWRRVPLEVHQITTVSFVGGMPEMVHSSANHGRQRGKRGDMPAKVTAVGRIVLVSTNHHRHCIPANVGADALLKLHIPGAWHFEMRRDRIEIGRMRRKWDVGARTAGLLDQLFQQRVRALRALARDHSLQRIQPLPRFLRIRVIGGTTNLFGYCIHRMSPVEGPIDPGFSRDPHGIPDFFKYSGSFRELARYIFRMGKHFSRYEKNLEN